MRSMPSRNAPASLSPSPCRTTISADRAGVGAIARGLVRLVLSAALLCLISLPSTARAQTCGLVTACCFSQQPASFVACEQVSQNHAFTFTAVFHGGRSSEWNTTYQWYKRVNGVETPVGGMEWGWTANYTIYGWSPTEVGDYRCQFFEQVEPYGGPDEFSYPDGIACGVFYSNYGSYAVTPTVRVAGVPADDQMKCAGDAVTFTMQVSGSATFQWTDGVGNPIANGTRSWGTVVSGAQTGTLRLSNVHTQDNGFFKCTATGANGWCGTASWPNASAQLSVVSGPPSVTFSPVTRTICAGTSTTFSVSASGPSLTYQWYAFYPSSGSRFPLGDGHPLGGATIFAGTGTDTLTISNVVPTSSAKYYCVVSNFCGTVTPAAAQYSTLSVPNNVTINSVTFPASQTLCAGDANSTLTISCLASGANPLYYQWYKRVGGNDVPQSDGTLADGTIITNSHNYAFTLANAGTGAAGDYFCRVSSSSSLTPGCGTVDSPLMTVRVRSGPPNVTSQPTDFQICALGQTATFTAAASRTDTYEWRIYTNATTTVPLVNGTRPSGTVVAGADTATLTLSNVQAAEVNVAFVCYVYNECGLNFTYLSGVRVLNYPAPAITANPVQPGLSCQGSTATFTVGASSGNLSYQWMRNGVDLTEGGNYSNVNTATLSVVRSTSSADGYFACRVWNDCGTATSTGALLTMSLPITIAAQPVPRTVCPGSNPSFSVVPAGAGPFTYQWQKGTTNLVNSARVFGATTSILQITGVTSADAANYRCRITNSCGNVFTVAVALAINTVPNVTTQPAASVVACPGGPATFTVAATGSPAPTFQWRKNGVNIPGATNATLTIAAASAADEGAYDCVATNTCGSDTSNASTLAVNATLPVITADPASLSRCLGGIDTTTFSVTASATPALTYQWKKNNANIAGATGATYTLSVPTTNSQAATYTCVVTSLCGSVTSAGAVLTVNTAAPTISLSPVSQSSCIGGSVTFTASALGAGNSYRWQRQRPGQGFLNMSDGVGTAGTLTDTLTLTDIDANDFATYRCRVTNGCGTTSSGSAVLTVNSAPSIGTQPSAATVAPGGNATFSVAAGGAPTPVYAWRLGGTPLADGPQAGGSVVSGSTTGLLSITGVTSSDSGTYDCVVTNTCGAATTDGVFLTISSACNVADIVGIGGSLPSDGLLTGDDFNAFIAAFASSDPLADIVGIGGAPPPDGLITGDDFNAFIGAFAAGCP